MELIDDCTSSMVDLLMQQVSTQKYSKPSRLAWSEQSVILAAAGLSFQRPLSMSPKMTSLAASRLHVWDSIEYGGIVSKNSVRLSSPFWLRLISRMVPISRLKWGCNPHGQDMVGLRKITRVLCAGGGVLERSRALMKRDGGCAA